MTFPLLKWTYKKTCVNMDDIS